MTETAPAKKSPSTKKWMAQADLPEEASTVKKMNGQSLLLSSDKMTHYFKEWTTENGALKKCLYRKLMLQIDPFSSS